ncbi:MAG: hypothetical protein JWM99_1286 [Verrucomicrobiales bacterium]|nr:hypothetical protein [Verrucomicrobiales bacterium]
MIGFGVYLDRITAQCTKNTAYVGMEVGSDVFRDRTLPVLRGEDEVKITFASDCGMREFAKPLAPFSRRIFWTL